MNKNDSAARKLVVKKFKEKYQGRLVMLIGGPNSVFVGTFNRGEKSIEHHVRLDGHLANIVLIDFCDASNKYYDINTDELLFIKILCGNKIYTSRNHLVCSKELPANDLEEQFNRIFDDKFELVNVDLILKHKDLQKDCLDSIDKWLERQVFPEGIENYRVKTLENFDVAPGMAVRILDYRTKTPEIKKDKIVYPLAIKRNTDKRNFAFLFHSGGLVYKYEFDDLPQKGPKHDLDLHKTKEKTSLDVAFEISTHYNYKNS